MPRTIGAGLAASIAAERASLVHFIELNPSTGALRICTAPSDISWNGFTWLGVGGHLVWGGVVESSDAKGYGATLELSGVSGDVITLLLTSHFRGREAVIWYGHIDQAAGTVISSPLEIYRGWMNDAFRVEESRSERGAGTVVVKTRVMSRLGALLGHARPVRTNLHSHRDMLRRAGFTGGDLGDDFFKFVASLVGKPIYWGTEAPHQPGIIRDTITGGGDDD